MVINSDDDDTPPPPGDVTAWRAAISYGRLEGLRPEEIVVAIQTLLPNGDKVVLNALAKFLSDLMMRMLRARIGRNHPNEGVDIINRVHTQLWDAILRPDSADGKGLRTAFTARLNFRIKDAIAVEYRALRARHDQMEAANATPAVQDEQSVASFEPTVPSGAAELDEKLDVEDVLATISDPKKRLAFRLFMDGLPFKSTRSNSIAEALGINEKTARAWVAEAQELLKQTMGDKT